MLVLGGGGYTIRNVARCWTYETSVLLNTSLSNELPYNEYYEFFGPDFNLHPTLTSSAMHGPSSDYRTTIRDIPNQNTRNYLETINSKVIEHLRLLDGAPSVQMSEIPPDLLGEVDGYIDNIDEEMEKMTKDEYEDLGLDEESRKFEDERQTTFIEP